MQQCEQESNIVLIGMPGAGKSTIAGMLGEIMGRPVIDTDDEIEKRTGESPCRIITERGEKEFRKIENSVLCDIGNRTGSIIATGGGVVVNEENYEALHKNGIVVWLQRDLEILANDGRPILKQIGAKELYRQRKELYEKFADVTVENTGDVKTSAMAVLHEVQKRWRKMKILVINGPNINLLGVREPDIYGKQDYKALIELIQSTAEEEKIEVECYQSNHEGDIVDKIQSALGVFDGIVINPAAYTHTSIAILDAVKAVAIPTVEVHISDVNAREEFRKLSYVGMACIKTYAGLGIEGYRQAMKYLKSYLGM